MHTKKCSPNGQKFCIRNKRLNLFEEGGFISKYLTMLVVFLIIIGSSVAYAESFTEVDTYYSEPGNLRFDSLNVRFVGNCPFGPARTVVGDEIRDTIFLGSGGGVYILDVSTPDNPIKVSESIHMKVGESVKSLFYDTNSERLYINGGKMFEIWDVSNHTSPTRLGYYDKLWDGEDLYVSDSYAYVADEDSGLRVIDVSTPSNPVEVGFYNVPSLARGVYVSGSYVYVAGRGDGLRVIDVSTPSNPVEVGYCGTPESAYDVYVSGSYAYVAATSGFHVIDVSTPTNPFEVGSCSANLEDVYLVGSYAYVSGISRLLIIDILVPSIPFVVGYCDISPGSAQDIYLLGNYAYIAAHTAGLRVIDVSAPTNPIEVGQYDTPGSAQDIYVSGTYAYIADHI